jgi:hypothetical protein
MKKLKVSDVAAAENNSDNLPIIEQRVSIKLDTDSLNGHETRVYVDGEDLDGIRSVSINIDRGEQTVTLVMYLPFVKVIT